MRHHTPSTLSSAGSLASLLIGLLLLPAFAHASGPGRDLVIEVPGRAPVSGTLAVPDGSGGAWIAWESGEGVFVSRVYGGESDPGPLDVLTIEAGSGSRIAGTLRAVETGDGGSILSWLNRTGGAETEAVLVRLDESGRVAGQIHLPSAGGSPDLTADGLGGVIVLRRPAGADSPVIERYDSSLQPAWSAAQFSPAGANAFVLETDRVGGAFVLWLQPDAAGSSVSLRAQRFDEFGWTNWPDPGVEVLHGAAAAAAVADHRGGLIAAWADGDALAFARVDAAGTVEPGRVLAGGPVEEFLVSASDERDLLYALKVAGRTASGAERAATLLGGHLEGNGPVPLARVPAASRLSGLAPDGSGGGSLFWIAPRESGRELMSRRWTAPGGPDGPENGRVLAAGLPGSGSLTGSSAGRIALAMDDHGRGVLAWPAADGRGDAQANVAARPFAAPVTNLTKDVDIGSFFFSPANVDIAAGDIVKWHWTGGSHTTTSGTCAGACTPSGVWNSPVKSGGTFSFTFTTAGSFDYFCGVHGASMQGNVTVTGSLPLTCDATATPASGEAHLTAGFNSNISGGTPPYTIGWNFDDGGTSSLPTPSHTFTAAGDFLAQLDVTDSDGTTCADSVLVTVTPCIGRTLDSITVKVKKLKVKVTILGPAFDKTDRLQIDAGTGFVDVVGAKVKTKKIKVKDAAAVFPAGIPVQFRVLQTNNCASASLPAQR